MKQVPFAVWRLMLAYALMMGGTALTVLIAGIIGTQFAPSKDLATLPVALAVVGVAASTLPTGYLQHRLGRRLVFIVYALLAIAAALLCAWALEKSSFILFCAGTTMMGWAAAAGHQYRFAALEMVPPTQAPQATSVLLLGGILGAFIGPELAVGGRFLLRTEYVGSYLLLACAYVLGLMIILFFREAERQEQPPAHQAFAWGSIWRNPILLLAIASAAAGYGVMTFLMTATPISMHEHAGHSLQATKWVIQSHIAGMYVPSLFFAFLLARFGYRRMLWAGVSAYLLTIAVALWATDLVNFWVSLVLLGIGWNFLFLAGTNLLPQGYQPHDRFKVQAANDFLIFSIQAMVALGSGWFLFHFQWPGVLWAALAPVVLFAVLLLRTPVFKQLKQEKAVRGTT